MHNVHVYTCTQVCVYTGYVHVLMVYIVVSIFILSLEVLIFFNPDPLIDQRGQTSS